ncbi:MAG TPA: GGDEF domain-containing protein, partial [Candidatus Angelobacter sp.]|nr:GGDEF domain-containing protein [Candidatus Angelobacter sp.]
SARFIPSEGLMSVVEFIGKQSRAIQISLGSILLLLAGTGALFASSSFLEFSVFFIIPVAYFTWFIHRKAGAMASAVSAAVTLWANIASPLHVSHPDVVYWNALIWFSFFVSITFIVAALKSLHNRERQLSRVDSLTGIGNRLAFYEFATAERNRALRNHQPITLAYLDLDGFKEINDTLGHQIGDQVLANVARTMQTSVRQTDMVARMGGDEFALILPDTNKAAANTVLEKVLAMLTHAMLQKGWGVTFSMGAVTFLAPPAPVQEMIAGADQVMFSVKKCGKNWLQQEVHGSSGANAAPSIGG